MKLGYSPGTDLNAQYKKLVESITDYAVYILDPDGVIISWNPGAERIKGYPEAEILGKSFARFYAPEAQASGEPAKSLEMARNDGRFEANAWRHRKDGTRFWAHVIIDPMYDGDELIGFAKITRDITAQKIAQDKLEAALAAAEAANKAKSDFLAVMSHEIRTPLNGVLGMAQAMAADELSDKQRGRLEVVQESGEVLLAILNDLLDLSRIEAGKLELECVEFNLEEVVRGAHAAFTAVANAKGVSFALDLEGARGVYLGDPTRIRQILYNLLSNALKFTSAGEIRVDVRRDADLLTLCVTDSGIGMSEAAAAALFQKFTQADSSTTRRFGGSGLGLAICDQLVRLMDGRISVTSRLDEGTRVTVQLPLPYVDKVASRSAAAAEPLGPLTVSRPLRVLAAEDNVVNQLVLKTILGQLGVEPKIVENGVEALAAWRREDWDLVLMDVQMPEMDGPSAVREIRRQENEAGRSRTPILALSANAMAHQVSSYIEAGMDGHIAKPIRVKALLTAMQAALAA